MGVAGVEADISDRWAGSVEVMDKPGLSETESEQPLGAELSLPVPLPLPQQAPEGFRSGFVALIGRPNVGKSTLLNHLVGEKVAITSPVAQTTRNRLRAILTTPSAQLVLLDTPGIHKPHHLLGERLVKSARSAIGEVDVVLLLVDGSEPAGRGDGFIVELLRFSKAPVLVALNKSDLVDPERAAELEASYRELLALSDQRADPADPGQRGPTRSTRRPEDVARVHRHVPGVVVIGFDRGVDERLVHPGAVIRGRADRRPGPIARVGPVDLGRSALGQAQGSDQSECQQPAQSPDRDSSSADGRTGARTSE